VEIEQIRAREENPMSVDTLRIGIIAPPWLPVPPPAYGGTELMIDALCNGLERLGHDVTLFTIGASTCPVERRWLFDTVDPARMGAAIEEFRHAFAAYDVLDDVDIVHDHTLAGLLIGPHRAHVPLVTTIHGPFDEALSDLYERTSRQVPVVAISHDQARSAPSTIRLAGIVHHGIELARYPFVAEPDDHVVFLGRVSPDKGVRQAIEIARRAGRELLIAAKLREPPELEYFHSVIEPLLGPDVVYVGEASFDEKIELLSKATALVNPIQWPEPFGLVMTEAMACGTPVIGGALGAAPEIVEHGRTGFLSNEVGALVDGLVRIESIDRSVCRRVVAERFTSDRMAADYADIYRDLLDERSPVRHHVA
jgi:glycosyltransferase involved in cell wall biosynthesis